MEVLNKKVSLIIPAWNEAPRVAKVLKVVEHHPLLDEILVIDDGSTDGTAEAVKKFNVTLVINEKNLGKTMTVKKGIALAKNDIIMMIDADLNGLDAEAITSLLEPVLDGHVDWTLSLRGNSMWFMKLLGLDWVSGERVIPKYLLQDPLIWSRADVSYGLETLLNKSLLNQHTTFRSVYLPNLTITNKSEKIGFWKGMSGEVKMIRQIMRVMSLPNVIIQYYKMVRLNKKYSHVKAEKEYSEA